MEKKPEFYIAVNKKEGNAREHVKLLKENKIKNLKKINLIKIIPLKKVNSNSPLRIKRAILARKGPLERPAKNVIIIIIIKTAGLIN